MFRTYIVTQSNKPQNQKAFKMENVQNVSILFGFDQGRAGKVYRYLVYIIDNPSLLHIWRGHKLYIVNEPNTSGQ